MGRGRWAWPMPTPTPVARPSTGATSIPGGPARVDVANGLPSTTNVTMAANTSFVLNGVADSIGSLGDGGSPSTTESVPLAGALASLTVGASNLSTTFT